MLLAFCPDAATTKAQIDSGNKLAKQYFKDT